MTVVSQLQLNNILLRNDSTWVSVWGGDTLEFERCGYLSARGVCKKEHNNKQSHINQESFQNAIKYSQSKVDHCLPPEKRAS